MVLNKLLNKPSRKHRLDTAAHTNSPSSPEKHSPASPSSARNSQDRERRHNLSPTKSSNRTSKRLEKDSHPLNLPPDLRRLSALSAMSTNSDQNHDLNVEPPQLSSPGTQSSTPTTPSTTYINSPFHQDDRPPVPPHRVPTSPPPTSPSPMPNVAPPNAETFKIAGNNFFKTQNYAEAVEEYSKGICAQSRQRRESNII